MTGAQLTRAVTACVSAAAASVTAALPDLLQHQAPHADTISQLGTAAFK
jgi:hypothetical protein